MNRIPAPEEDFEKNKYVGYSSVICNMDGNYDNGLEMIFGGPRGNTYKGEVGVRMVTTKFICIFMFSLKIPKVKIFFIRKLFVSRLESRWRFSRN